MAELRNEKELEDYIVELLDDGVFEYIDGEPFRQVSITGYGIIDILVIDVEHITSETTFLHIHIIELKKGKIDLSALGQICRYRKGIINAINKNPEIFGKYKFDIKGYLIGSEIELNGDFCYVPENIDWLSILIYELSLSQGLMFNEADMDYFSNQEDFTQFIKWFESFKVAYNMKLTPHPQE